MSLDPSEPARANQLIVAAPERALHRLPTVLSPAAALQLEEGVLGDDLQPRALLL